MIAHTIDPATIFTHGGADTKAEHTVNDRATRGDAGFIIGAAMADGADLSAGIAGEFVQVWLWRDETDRAALRA